MNSNLFFFRLYSLAENAKPTFIGNAFPIAPNGKFLTCRHVVQAVPEGARLALFDNLSQKMIEIPSSPQLPSKEAVDLALLTVPVANSYFLPILSPMKLRVGEDAYTYGYFAIGGDSNQIENGYFAGKIVNFSNANDASVAAITLPFQASRAYREARC
jgi:hypothetical protein